MDKYVHVQATPNNSARTFTLRKSFCGRVFAKYRTLPYDRATFNRLKGNVSDDWKTYLKMSNDYYVFNNPPKP